MKISILGEGAWGRAIGALVKTQGHDVAFIHHEQTKWPGKNHEVVFTALPVQSMRKTLSKLPAPGVPVLSLSKGLEIETGYRVSEIITEVWKEKRVAALSGPTFAAEVAKGLPATSVIASNDDKLARSFQDILHQPNFRIYRSSDLVGVEMGGALKNVYALAGGICIGLKLGENSFAGLITRCLAEMIRIGVKAGGRPETFAGLSGIGDLVLTAMSMQSRNHRVGRFLAEGRTLDQALELAGGVAEGVPTAKSVYLNKSIDADSKPIAVEVYRLLYEQKPIQSAVRDLLGRAQKEE